MHDRDEDLSGVMALADAVHTFFEILGIVLFVLGVAFFGAIKAGMI